ncbi:DUF4062 domain-containing protein [Hoeflea sp.]|uniref:DUF4062 domain-containing protein n=1 Tax=Hoeflea sp. TaxID=1940281 RepID=UPI003B02D910
MRIFVSSTFEDLRDYREAAIRGLRQLGHDIVAMEDFTANTAPPISVVIERVRECEAYLGIFAWRYGYKPKEKDALPSDIALPEGTKFKDTSITHIEYLEAKSLNKPILAFLLEETAPWPANLIDPVVLKSSKNKSNGTDSAIRKLRSQLQRERIVGYFKTPADLEARVTTAVTNLGMSLGVETNLLDPTETVESMEGSSAGRDIAAEVRQAVNSGQLTSTIDIHDGTKWWQTRLFLLAILAKEFTNIEKIVFLSEDDFVGMVSVRMVIDILGMTDKKLTRFQAKLRGRSVSMTDSQNAIDAAYTEWMKIVPRSTEEQHKLNVTRANLKAWFGDAMLTKAIEVEDIERVTLPDLLRVIDYPSDLVPIRSRSGQAEDTGTAEPTTQQTKRPLPIRVIDKRAMNEMLAQQYIHELVDKSR